MKTILAGAALAAVAVAIPVASDAAQIHGSGSATKAAPTALASVNMEAVLKAAQIDPRRADDTLTPGAKSSVLAVEQALQAKGLLDKKWVDGYFGTTTVKAYTEFQKSIGYKGLAANGVPGKSSLAKLGDKRFTVNHALTPGARVTFRGATVNTRTKAMLVKTEQLLGRKLVLEQGSYNPGGDPTSAGTHDGGGVVDISVKGLDAKGKNTLVRTLRTVGFAAWSRTPSQGDWPFHVHAAAINDPDLSSQAQHQTGDYYLGKNGLANGAKDDGPKVNPIQTWEEFQRQS
ncbi:peptidoglycan-binding domain-containing protein [Luteipulveratus mongoliensis]|uniref:Peptidoglycan-binding protein n=1 Tax=Luteipulveratus mongoliensis TaxID=571913 RepID=A0A0K1JEN0_9MICO|nr:peptidoglycan-binding protein [Luteipulveratus mongoliensis]AKU15159.1 peptidoglycan-binding protein [Luteipulveratus mongoliensis]